MSGKFRKILLVFVIVSIVGLALSAYLNYWLRSKVPIEYESVEPTPEGDVHIERVRYSGTNEGRLAWELVADSAVYMKADDRADMDTVLLTFYAKSGVTYTLTSLTGSYSPDKEFISATGDVVVVSTDGYRLETSELEYSNKTRLIESTKDVEIDSERFNVKGTGLIMDVDKGRLRVLDSVRTELKNAVIQ